MELYISNIRQIVENSPNLSAEEATQILYNLHALEQDLNRYRQSANAQLRASDLRFRKLQQEQEL